MMRLDRISYLLSATGQLTLIWRRQERHNVQVVRTHHQRLFLIRSSNKDGAKVKLDRFKMNY